MKNNSITIWFELYYLERTITTQFQWWDTVTQIKLGGASTLLGRSWKINRVMKHIYWGSAGIVVGDEKQRQVTTSPHTPILFCQFRVLWLPKFFFNNNFFFFEKIKISSICRLYAQVFVNMFRWFIVKQLYEVNEFDQQT